MEANRGVTVLYYNGFSLLASSPLTHRIYYLGSLEANIYLSEIESGAGIVMGPKTNCGSVNNCMQNLSKCDFEIASSLEVECVILFFLRTHCIALYCSCLKYFNDCSSEIPKKITPTIFFVNC